MIHSRPFQFFNGDVPLAARIHRNIDDLDARQPAVLITGSWLTVKEQMADRYAAELAARGYTAITFDFAGWGASGGAPRQAELPTRKIDEGWFHDTTTVAPFYGGPDGVSMRLDRASEAFDLYQSNGEVRTVPAYEAGNDRAGMSLELPYYAEPGRGAVPTWLNEMAEFSWAYWLTFDGLSVAPAVSTPTLFVHGDGCVLPDNVRTVAAALGGPAEVVWAEGGQIDFYDQDAQVALAVDAADRHYRTTLAS
ncbi:alpha/beta hydrolase [Pseudonocardia sp. TRM90224]|uniref:alpha/beta hydrolase n=1 Tax=Pseudonocardia sp. TRM90224 TaxID=2812678 RepID=UPI001E5143C8|nr:hypothetical protein [Pseudonocardia sp. TRM90224]